MWRRGPLFSPRCLRPGCAFWRGWMRGALPIFAAALLLTAQGCSSLSSTPAGIPPLPVLTSLRRATLDGMPGVWMNSDDAGRLAQWIYDVTGEAGQ